ncbi:MAG: hypothetical protein R3F39_10740 [Myxococcota bacterium]
MPRPKSQQAWTAAALLWAALPVVLTAFVYAKPAGCWFYSMRRGEQSFSEWATLAQYAMAFTLLAFRLPTLQARPRRALMAALAVIALIFLEEANWGQVLSGRPLFFDPDQRSIHTLLQTTDYGPINTAAALLSELPPLILLFLVATWLPLLAIYQSKAPTLRHLALLALPALSAALTIAIFQWGESQTALTQHCAPTLIEEIIELTDATLLTYLAIVWQANPELTAPAAAPQIGTHS